MATSWAPAWDQHGSTPRVVTAQRNTALLDRLLTQTALPLASTPMTGWLMTEAGYTPPATPGAVPTVGQLWPR